MKILKLHFSNINSLVGEWTIDFTDPSYDAGILALTGPTGSGKSSVLDAVSLALYGQTPRISSFSTTQDEVMNRQCSSCFSNLVFEVRGEVYRAGWSHRRTKNGSKYPFAQPVPVLEKFADGAWDTIASKAKEKDALVIEITGLSFHQFTRSVLLAQGEFASFLKANAQEKASILEQVTGEQIYKQLSMKIHEVNVAKKQAYEEKKKELGLLKVLDEEQLRALIDQRAQFESERQKLNTDVQDLNEKLKRVEKTAEVRRKFEEKTAQLKAAENEIPTNTEREARLKNAEAAQAISTAYHDLNQACIQEKQFRQEAANQFKAISVQKVQIDETEKTLKVQEEKLSDLKKRKELELPIFEQVTLLDNEIQAQQKIVHEADVRFKNASAKLKEAKDVSEQAQRMAAEVQKRLSRAEQTLDSAKPFEWLSTHKNALIRFKENFVVFETNIKSINANLAEDRREELRISGDLARLSAEKKNLEAGIAKTQEALEKISSAQSHELGGLAPERLREEISNQEQAAREFSLLLEQSERIAKASLGLQRKEDKIRALEQKLAVQIKEVEAKKELRSQLETSLKQLQDLSAIDRLVRERAALEDGKPCPLCGSLIHPFVDHLPEGVKEAKVQAKKTEKSLTELEENVELLEKNFAADQGQLSAEKQSFCHDQEVLKEDKDELATRLKSVGISETEPSKVISTLSQRIQQSQSAAAGGREAMQKFAQFSLQSQALLKKLEEQKEKLSGHDRKIGAAEGALEAVRDGICKSEQSLRARLKAQSDERLAFVKDFPNFVPQDSEKINASEMEWLARQGESFDKAFSACIQAQEQAKAAENALATAADALKDAVRTRDEEQKDCEEKSRLFGDKKEARFRLFADKSPAEEKRRLEARVGKSQETFELVRQKLTDLKNACSQSQGAYDSAKNNADRLVPKISSLQSVWVQKLQSAGFADEAAWQAANLEPLALQSLRSEIQNFRTRLEKTRADAQEAQEELQALTKSPKTVENAETLTVLIAECSQKIETLSQEIGKLDQQKHDDDEKRIQAAEKTKFLETLKKELEVWIRLNSLVGSHDGAKYNTYFQSIVLQFLLRFANEELKRLKSRYQLISNPKSPLDISVIDGDLANQIRPSSNLSGGESFIVSLALALGLSRMASKNVRIDSLFLDEGFGTLDEESLEKALSVLGTLNAQGKLVCVISHIQQVKDRLPVHINVSRTKLPGVSALEGPGVTGTRMSPDREDTVKHR